MQGDARLRTRNEPHPVGAVAAGVLDEDAQRAGLDAGTLGAGLAAEDLSMYALKDDTAVRHVMVKLSPTTAAVVRTSRRRGPRYSGAAPRILPMMLKSPVKWKVSGLATPSS